MGFFKQKHFRNFVTTPLEIIQTDTKPTLLNKLLLKPTSFVDWKRIRIVSGKGGDGAISYDKSCTYILL